PTRPWLPVPRWRAAQAFRLRGTGSRAAALDMARRARFERGRSGELDLVLARRGSVRARRPGVRVRGAADAGALVRGAHPARLLRNRLPGVRPLHGGTVVADW